MISVIIPHFQRLQLLQQTLLSLERQSFTDWEAVVVDDGSEPQVWDALQRLQSERVRVLRREDGLRGPSRCRNLGLEVSRGEFVLFLDSDDLLGSDCLLTRSKAVLEQPEFDFWVFPAELFCDLPGDLQVSWNVMSETGDDLQRFLRSDGPWCVSSSFWRRAALQRIGGFNELVMYGDDADLHIRALLSGLRYCQYPRHLPDIFIRRSAVPRITGGQVSDSLLQSRLVRLSQVRRALCGAQCAPRLLQLWQSQYFMEGEFLLFNRAVDGVWLGRLYRQWRDEYPQVSWHRWLAEMYFGWSMFWRDRWYLQVRLARRLAMLLLPNEWFGGPGAGGSG